MAVHQLQIRPSDRSHYDHSVLERSLRRQSDSRWSVTNDSVDNADESAVLYADLDTELAVDAVAQILDCLNAHPDDAALFGDAIVGGRWRRRGAWSPLRAITDPGDLDALVIRSGAAPTGSSTGVAARIRAVTHLHQQSVEPIHLAAPLLSRQLAPALDTDAIGAHQFLAQTFGVSVEPCAGRTDTYAVKPAPQTPVSVVIPTAAAAGPDGTPMVNRCLDGLAGRPDIDIVIVVGDELRADIQPMADRHGARVLHRPPGEFNFSMAINHGLLAARHELVAIVNDDTESADPAWLDRLAGHFVDPSIAAAGVLLTYPDGSVQHSGVIIDDAWPLHPFVGQSVDVLADTHTDVARDIVAVTGACMLVRRSAALAVGGFCTDLPLSFNDIDFCLKLRHRGHRVIIDPDARLVHHESQSREPVIEDWEWDCFVGRWGSVTDPYYHPGHHRPDDPAARHRNADHLDPATDPTGFGARRSTIEPRVHRSRPLAGQ